MNGTTVHRWTGLVILVLSLQSAAMASAPASSSDDDQLGDGRERHLGGHAFLPSEYVSDPWVGTHVRNYTGAGIGVDLEAPFLDRDGETVYVLKGDVLFAALGLSFQQRFGGKNAVGLSVDARVRSGINTPTLIVEGANVDRSLNLWYKRLIHRGETSQFSLGVDWNYDKTFLIDPAGFARGIIDGDDLDEAPLLDDIKGWTTRLTLDYARAFSPAFGLRLDGAIGLYEEPLASGVAKAAHRLGLLLELDLKHRWSRVPIGFTLGRTQGFPADDPAAGLSGTLFGVWYTGRESFVAGVESGYMTLPVYDSDDSIDAVYAIMDFRFYF